MHMCVKSEVHNTNIKNTWDLVNVIDVYMHGS